MLSVPGVDGVSCSQADTHHTLVLSGSPFVRDQVSVPTPRGVIEVTLIRHARSFFQANRFLLADLVAAVVEAVPGGHVIDLYAGVGLFAVALAAAGDREVVAIEGDRLAADDLKTNAGAAAGPIRARHQSVETYLAVDRPLTSHTTIVDPPRTGLSREAIGGLLMWKPQQIVYVSCDAATFARDARGLVDAGYKLRGVRAFDLFPNTAHVETVAVLER
jgi:23S rRNA (uracil1939-C5)-methyltransferase